MAQEEEKPVGGGHPGIDLFAYATSPFAAKVRCYLDYKGLLHNTIYVDPIRSRQIGFTGGKQIPVLQMDDQWRLESTDIGLWLDERFPDPPLLPEDPSERQRVLELDGWVTASLIPALFRRSLASGWGNRLINGWRLGYCLHRTRPLPLPVLLLWPLVLPRAPFIQAILAKTDPDESLEAMEQRLIHETVKRLAGGPYLGGRQEISLADLSAFPQFLLPHALGLGGKLPYLDCPPVMAWLRRVQARLPANPLLVPDELLTNPLPL